MTEPDTTELHGNEYSVLQFELNKRKLPRQCVKVCNTCCVSASSCAKRAHLALVVPYRLVRQVTPSRSV